MRNWRPYSLVFITAACATGIVGFWWERQTMRMVTAQDAAECLAAAAERYAALDFGYGNLSFNASVIQTNWVAYTNYYVDATINAGVYSFSPNPVRFYLTNWANPVIVTSTPTSWTPSEDHRYRINGNVDAALYCTPIGTYGIYDFENTWPNLELEGRRLICNTNQSISFWIRLKTMPSKDFNSGNAGVTSSNYVVSVPPSDWTIGPVVRLDDMKKSLGKLRSINQYFNGIAWVDPSVTFNDGDTLASVGGGYTPYVSSSNYLAAADRWTYYWDFRDDPTNRFSQFLTFADRQMDTSRVDCVYLPWTVGGESTNHVIASWIYGCNDAPEQDVYGADGNWWTKNGLSPYACSLAYEIVSNKLLSGYNYTITTNNLNQAKRLANKMTRTIAWVGSGTCTNVVNHHFHASTNYVVASGGFPPSVDGILGILGGQVVDDGEGGGANLFTAGFSSGIEKRWGESDYQAKPDGTLNHMEWQYGNNNAFFTCYTHLYKGMTLPYPAAWCLASGLVENVQIFVCTKASVYVGPPMAISWTNGTYSATRASADWPSGFEWGNIRYVDTVSVNLPPSPDQNIHRRDQVLGYVPEVARRLCLVATASNPTKPVEFDLGGEEIVFPSSGETAFSVGTGEYHFLEDSEWTYSKVDDFHEWTSAAWERELSIAGFLVVVDWRFHHLNDFSPETFHPQWTQP